MHGGGFAGGMRGGMAGGGIGGGFRGMAGSPHFAAIGPGPGFVGGSRFVGSPRFAGARFADAPFTRAAFGPHFSRFAFHHRFFHDRFRRFAFVGVGFPYYYGDYGYYDGCWSRVWTAYGPQWVNVCGDYGVY